MTHPTDPANGAMMTDEQINTTALREHAAKGFSDECLLPKGSVKRIADELDSLRALLSASAPAAPHGWMRDVLAYLEEGIETAGPMEAEHSIEARRLVAMAPAVPAGSGEPVATVDATALSDAYYFVTGKSPAWSEKFTRGDAVEEIKQSVNLLRRRAVSDDISFVLDRMTKMVTWEPAQMTREELVKRLENVNTMLYNVLSGGTREAYRRSTPPPENIWDDAAPQSSLPAKAGEVFPYQKTFDAIAAATSVSGGHIAISVSKFKEAFGLASEQSAVALDDERAAVKSAYVDWELVERVRNAEELDSEEAGMLGAMIDGQADEIAALRSSLEARAAFPQAPKGDERAVFKPVGRCECAFSQDECEVCESNREAYQEWQMENEAIVRVEFEAWAKSAGYPLEMTPGASTDYSYLSRETCVALEAWKAARAAAPQAGAGLTEAQRGYLETAARSAEFEGRSTLAAGLRSILSHPTGKAEDAQAGRQLTLLRQAKYHLEQHASEYGHPAQTELIDAIGNHLTAAQPESGSDRG